MIDNNVTETAIAGISLIRITKESDRNISIELVQTKSH